MEKLIYGPDGAVARRMYHVVTPVETMDLSNRQNIVGVENHAGVDRVVDLPDNLGRSIRMRLVRIHDPMGDRVRVIRESDCHR